MLVLRHRRAAMQNENRWIILVGTFGKEMATWEIYPAPSPAYTLPYLQLYALALVLAKLR